MAKKVAKKSPARSKPKPKGKSAPASKASKKRPPSRSKASKTAKAATTSASPRRAKAAASHPSAAAPRAVNQAPPKSKRTKIGVPRAASRATPNARPAVSVEAKPISRRPVKPDFVPTPPAPAPPAPPVFPISPASGQRDVDLATAIQKSRMFYAGHGLGALASAIPSAADFPPEVNAAIEDAHAVGLDDVFVFPPLALQRDSLEHLVHKLAAAASDRLSGDQQYGQPWLYKPEMLKSFAVHGRPTDAYALCFYSGPFPSATSGKDAGELRGWLDQRRCASLTVYEYLVLQRLRAEQHGDHRFDLNSKDAACQWHWLLDMSDGVGKDAKFPMAGWNPKMRRIELGLCGPRDLSPGKGAHATRVVPAGPPASPEHARGAAASSRQD